MMYTGDDSVYTYTFEHLKKDDCPVCGNLAKPLELDENMTLGDLVESFAERPEAQLKKPSVRSEATTLYMQFPPSLEEQTRPNLKRKLFELLSSKEEIIVTDPAFATQFKFMVTFR
jgi:ubiquitin-activating enzyme E1 C